MASAEYNWLQEQGDQLAEFYPLNWIAVDGTLIPGNPNAIATIVVATGASLEETISSVALKYDPITLFYAYIRPPLETHSREEGRPNGNQRFV